MPLVGNKDAFDDPAGPLAADGGGDARRPVPRVWLILSDKLGDNAQVRTVADALPWPCEERRITVRRPYVLGKPRVRASLHHVDLARSDPLEPPWPDLVIAIGRRMSMVALWIQDRSHGRTRIALLGRPRRLLHRFDLVITSAQYRVPARKNVLRLAYPLVRVDEAAIATAAQERRAEFESLPRPLIALMVGGRIKPVRFDAETARALAAAVGRLVAEERGTLVVTTSRRTPQDVVEALAAALPPGAVLYQWTPNRRHNPYRALLGLADRFIVTGDSVSMLIDIAHIGKPLAIYPLPPSSWLLSGPLRWLGHRLHPGGELSASGGGLRVVGDLLYGLGLLGYSRDLTALHQLLIRQGLAVWFGQPFRPGGPGAPDELSQVVARIMALMN